MAGAAKWFDLVLGMDIHMVIIPGSPTPWPLPTFYLGIICDPVGGALGAALGHPPVLINGKPAATAATGVIALTHRAMPAGAVFAPDDSADGEGSVISGSTTVYLGGLPAARAGSLVSTCNYPINLPTSACFAFPSGAPVEIGGPEGIDAAAAMLAAFRTKWVSNKVHAAFNVTPRSRMSKVICTLTGHPVDVITGELLADAVDFDLPGPLPLVFERNYYSREKSSGVLGQGWRHPLEASVDESPLRAGQKTFEVRLPDGRISEHYALEVGQSEYRAQERYMLTRDAEGYTLASCEGITYRFERVPGSAVTHPLARISDRCGNTIALRYKDGCLHEATDSAGRLLRFLMKGGRLSSVRVLRTDQGTDGWHVLVRYAYDEDGSLAAAYNTEQHALRYEYKGGVMVKETDRNGRSFYFEYNWYDPGGDCVHTWGDDGLYERKITYHKPGYASIVDDGRGGRTTYCGNAAGLVEREIDPMGVERHYKWSHDYRKIAEIDAFGKRTEWAYDERGNCVLERDALGHETRWRYSSLNVPVEMTDAAGGVWRWSYDGRGKLLRETDPLGHETRFAHDARGMLVRTEDPLERTTMLEYDAQSNCIAVIEPGGATVRYEMDDLGRMRGSTDARGVEVKITRDACGLIKRLDRSDGTWITLKRDPEGNVLEREDEARCVWRYEYTGRNKLSAQQDPLGKVTRLEYDSEEEITTITNVIGETYTFERDRAGRVVREVGFDGRTTTCMYDQGGRCIRVTSGSGKWIAIEYDALHRVTHLTTAGIATPGKPVPEVEVAAYERDALGNVVRAKNGSIDLRLRRDALGRVIEEAAGEISVERAYDAAGALVRRRTNLGHEARFAWDAHGELEEASFGYDERFGDFAPESLALGQEVRAPWKAEFKRDGTGAEVMRVLPGEANSQWTRDRMGRPAVHRVYAGRSLCKREYQWKNDEMIEAIKSPHAGTTTFGHNRRGELIWSEGPDGLMHRAVDTVGNVYRAADTPDRKYGKGGRLLEADGVQYTYDADGQLTERVFPDGARWGYRWNALGRLIEVIRPDGVRVAFAYDAFGRRVGKSVNGVRTRFIWDGEEMIHELHQEAPLVTWVYEPGTFALIAKEEGDRRFAVVPDHLGVPMAFVDEQGEPAWFGELDVWGDLLWSEIEETENPWRFPGQYADLEVGLSYNRFRYYDVHSGRYISQDPLGPAGGLSLYGYVQDPLVWMDPAGLGPLLSGEGLVGTYGELLRARASGSELAAHHIPSNKYMSQLGAPGYSTRSGICMNMEHFTAGGGRHQRTRSFGTQPQTTLSPRSALAQELMDARSIYRAEGLYTQKIRDALRDVVKRNKTAFPTLFGKARNGCK